MRTQSTGCAWSSRLCMSWYAFCPKNPGPFFQLQWSAARKLVVSLCWHMMQHAFTRPPG